MHAPNPAVSQPTVAAVLAGGRGTRLGGAKAATLLGQDTLISYPLAAALNAGLEPLVVIKPDSELPALPASARVVREQEARHHPLAGLAAALSDTAERRPSDHPIVAIACDMPFLTSELLAWLAAQPDEEPVATALGGRTQPFPSLWRAQHAEAVQAALDAALSMRETLERLHARVLPEDELAAFGDPALLCSNVNDRGELAAAAASLGR